MVEVKDYGKDHWSVLSYLETLVVDDIKPEAMTSTIDPDRMRCNKNTHPQLAGTALRLSNKWEYLWGTRLFGHSEDNHRILKDHDDWDCLDDLEKAGFVEIISLANYFFKLTPEGFKVAIQIRAHKAGGGTFTTFKPNNL